MNQKRMNQPKWKHLLLILIIWLNANVAVTAMHHVLFPEKTGMCANAAAFGMRPKKRKATRQRLTALPKATSF